MNDKNTMQYKKILISAPPFVNQQEKFQEILSEFGFDVHWAESQQQLSENQLLKLLPEIDGWILGDDPCTRLVLAAGSSGRLKAVVKWGVGTDNIDFNAIKDLNLAFSNTPNAFGREVADLAMAYLINLSRHVLTVDNNVREGRWIKPAGFSLADKNIGLVGYGDIGKNISKRLQAADAKVSVYEIDPKRTNGVEHISICDWPEAVGDMDAIILACALTTENSEMINKEILKKTKKGLLIINVSRGGLICEEDLIDSLNSGRLGGAALDVYQIEPLPVSSALRECKNVIFGTHNASNTLEAVMRTSQTALETMRSFLNPA